MRWPIFVSAGCGAIYGYAFGSDLADIAIAFLPQDLIGQWIAADAALALPIGGVVGGVAALTLITALGAADLSTVIGLAGGTIVGLVVERPQSWNIMHPIDVAPTVLWQQLTAFAGVALVWGCKKLLNRSGWIRET
jgi:hypothetical protein